MILLPKVGHTTVPKTLGDQRPPEKSGVAESSKALPARGAPRTAGSWPAPRPKTLLGNAVTDNPLKNRSLGVGIPELCGNLMFSFSLSLRPQV